MKKFRADLHIHTLLSPCAGMEMTPKNIIRKAKSSGLHIIGITDHNSTKHAMLIKKMAREEGVFILTGAEITTKEEVHCLTFFEHPHQLEIFQQYLEENIVRIPNHEENFGYQPVIDEAENVLEMVPYVLSAALKTGISEIQQKVEEMNGIFIPAHVDRPANGIFSQLGFIPPGLKYDALGLSKFASEKDVKQHYVIENKTTFIRNSDAHYLEQIGEICTVFAMHKINFSEIKKALNQQGNRFCEIP